MKKILSIFIAMMVLAGALLTGCAAKVTTETTGAAPAAEAAKTWLIATDTVFKPFEYTNEKNEFVGIDVDLMAAIAEDQGFNYKLESLGWDAAVAAVQAGQADGLIAGATIKQERIDSGWIFSDGYFDATQTFVVGADS
ncbi:MAG: transporter substrate-binding domain-containing protein, partial [Clostridia bacterium]|nr:transporter substrate-binding domain-containing protein [Clostridia bacterium]